MTHLRDASESDNPRQKEGGRQASRRAGGQGADKEEQYLRDPQSGSGSRGHLAVLHVPAAALNAVPYEPTVPPLTVAGKKESRVYGSLQWRTGQALPGDPPWAAIEDIRAERSKWPTCEPSQILKICRLSEALACGFLSEL